MPLKDCGILNVSSTVTKSVKKRKRLDFLTVLKLSNVCVFRAQWRGGGGGGTPEFKWQGWSNGEKIKTPKISRALKPKKFPGPKFNQQKYPVSSHKNFQEALNDITIMNLQIVSNTQNNPYLNQAAQ